MVNHGNLSPRQGRRVAKHVSSRGRWPVLVARVSDAANQTSQNEIPPEKLVQPSRFDRILAILPFVHISDDRQSADGAAQVKIKCDEWVDYDYLMELEDYLKKREKQKLEKVASYFNRPLTREDEDRGRRAVAEAVAKVKFEQNAIIQSKRDLATEQATEATEATDQPSQYIHGLDLAPNRYPKRTKSSFVVLKPANRADSEEGEASDDSLFDINHMETDEESESDGQGVAVEGRTLRGGRCVSNWGMDDV